MSPDPAAELILKAQIHAGGRGKGHFDNGLKGGVKICKKCVLSWIARCGQQRAADRRHAHGLQAG